MYADYNGAIKSTSNKRYIRYADVFPLAQQRFLRLSHFYYRERFLRRKIVNWTEENYCCTPHQKSQVSRRFFRHVIAIACAYYQ